MAAILGAVDFDIVAHFIALKNIDLMSRGVYFIQATLRYGYDKRHLVSPVGVFSAPSTHDSFVKTSRLDAPPLLHPCQVDESLHHFRSRTFVVRYSWEVYDLNDGVHWRLTVPGVNISQLSDVDHPITSPEPVSILIELLFAPLNQAEGLDPTYDIEALLPDNHAVFERVASQELVVPRVTSGLHAYFPVHFERGQFVSLDLVLHVAATGARFQTYSFAALSAKSTTAAEAVVAAGTGTGIGENADAGAENDNAGLGSGVVYSVVGDITPESSQTAGGTSSSSSRANASILQPDKSHNQGAVAESESIQGSITITAEASIVIKSRFTQTLIPETTTITSGLTKPHVSPLRRLRNKIASVASKASHQKQLNFSPDEIEPSMLSIFACGATPLIGCSSRVSRLGFPREDMEELLAKYTACLSRNYQQLKRSTSAFVAMYEAKLPITHDEFASTVFDDFMFSFQDEEIVDEIVDAARHSSNGIGARGVSQFDSSADIAVVDELMDCASYDEIKEVLKERVDVCNMETAALWSNLFSVLPNIPRECRMRLAPVYRLKMRGFWKLQLLVHTCSGSNITRAHPDDDDNQQFLRRRLLQEHETSSASVLSGDNRTASVERAAPDMGQARSLDIIEAKLHDNIAKLPYITLQQYVSPSIQITASAIPAGQFFGCLDEVVVKAKKQNEGFHYSFLRGQDGDRRQDAATVTTAFPQSQSIGRPRLSDPAPTLPRILSVMGATFNQRMAAEGEGGVHLVVLQHGFEGTPYDMRYIRNYLLAEFPAFHVLACKSNEGLTYESIDDMGKRFAQEVVSYCVSNVSELLYPDLPGRISFIGHSLGGIIIRRALEEECMNRLRSKMYIYMSLASPHLGTLYAESQLVATGMWAIMKWSKCKSLKELSLDDGSLGRGMESTLLYRLSTSNCLKDFKRVILVSSPLDQYVPSYSARIQVPRRAENDYKNGPKIVKMAANLLSSISTESLVRVTLFNNVPETASAVDSFIGRAAHICYLDNPVIVQQLVYSMYPYLV